MRYLCRYSIKDENFQVYYEGESVEEVTEKINSTVPEEESLSSLVIEEDTEQDG